MKKWVIISIITFILLIIISLTGYYLLLSNSIKLNNKELIIDVKEDYDIPKYKANILGIDVSKNVKIKHNIDNNKLGTYKITYEINMLFKIKKYKIVKVVDREKPIIELIGESEVLTCPNKSYVDEGFKAYDNYDGDLNDQVETIIEKDKIIYKVKDSSNNETTIERLITYDDKEKPKITLKGGSVINYNLGGHYKENGYTALDNCSGDLTKKVKVTGSVNTNRAGQYKITYSVSDDAANKTEIVRTIVVKNTKAASSNNDKGVIYLTFDDGPHATNTKKILDVLKKYNVKATFFVTNSGPDSLIKREYNEGHTVALHTASHNYKLIYSSVDGYFSDLNKVSDRVYRLTGIRSKIIRFPGGSSNTVSRNYSPGIMSELSIEVVKRGYNYFDWNISSGDAGETTSAKGVYNNVTKRLSKSRGNIVLMHDIKPYTANAIEDIIQYGLKNNYEFRALKYDTKPVRHGINN